MSEFEYLAVIISVIFGISLTHVLAGAVRSVYRKKTEPSHFGWTLFFFLLINLNWWTGFSWRDQQVWSFDLFVVIVLWATTHYVVAITLYPPIAAGSEQPFEFRRNWFLWTFIAVGFADILQTAARGRIFTPWYYLPFVSHYVLLAVAGTLVNKPAYHRWLPWYFLTSLTIWSFAVRKLLV